MLVKLNNNNEKKSQYIHSEKIYPLHNKKHNTKNLLSKIICFRYLYYK